MNEISKTLCFVYIKYSLEIKNIHLEYLSSISKTKSCAHKNITKKGSSVFFS